MSLRSTKFLGTILALEKFNFKGMAKMVLVHFLEDNSIILSQLLKTYPSVDENIKIKGKKGKVISVKKMDETIVHVHVVFEKIIKKQPVTKDVKKKR